MSNEQLNTSLEELRAALADVDGLDEPARARIERLIADLEHQIGTPSDSGHRTSTAESLPNLIEHFEVEHPRITSILNQISVTLSGMGI